MKKAYLSNCTSNYSLVQQGSSISCYNLHCESTLYSVFDRIILSCFSKILFFPDYIPLLSFCNFCFVYVLCHVIYLKRTSSPMNMFLSLILWNNCVGIIPVSVSPIKLQYLSDIFPE